ncbi:hypothetical protein VNO80_07226 [Phaseolus coccineus]|uniref:Uncharacterized protein n=1 Tax=Phaseolus coccineus TaxID=3886 RepID=A0AAN9RIA5_PHACN
MIGVIPVEFGNLSVMDMLAGTLSNSYHVGHLGSHSNLIISSSSSSTCSYLYSLPPKEKKMMENYLSWAQALASAWGFMLVVALMCCCLSTKPRQDSDVISGNGGCTCDGGGQACV